MTNLQNFKKQLNSVAPIECGLKVGDRVIYKKRLWNQIWAIRSYRI